MAKRRTQKRRNEKYQVNNRRLRAKDQYKDTIFRMLYRDKENAFCALRRSQMRFRTAALRSITAACF